MDKKLSIFGKTKLKNFCTKNNIKYIVEQEFNGYGYVITDRYVVGDEDIKKVNDFILSLEEKEKIRRSKIIKKNKGNLDKLLLAIYTVNKEAKRQRDIKLNLADSIWGVDRKHKTKLLHYHLHNAKSDAEYYYSIKNIGIEKLIKLSVTDKIKVQIVNGVEMYCINVNGFSFHFDKKLINNSNDCSNYEFIKSEEYINELISSDKKIKGMSLKTALVTIFNY